MSLGGTRAVSPIVASPILKNKIEQGQASIFQDSLPTLVGIYTAADTHAPHSCQDCHPIQVAFHIIGPRQFKMWVFNFTQPRWTLCSRLHPSFYICSSPELPLPHGYYTLHPSTAVFLTSMYAQNYMQASSVVCNSKVCLVHISCSHLCGEKLNYTCSYKIYDINY